MTYIYLLKGFVRKMSFWIASLAVLGMQSLFLTLTDNVPTFFWLPCMLFAAMIMYVYLLICGRLTWLGAGYCCAQAFLLAEFTASLEWQLHSWLRAAGLGNPGCYALLVGCTYGTCFYVTARLEKPLLPREYLVQLTHREMWAAAGIVAVVFCFSNLSFIYGDSPFSGSLRSDIFNIRTLVDLGGIAILYAHQSRIVEYAAEKELNAIKAVLKSQYDQYRNYQDSLELIHMKHHDLKHQITALRAETDAQKREDWLDAMEEEISAFENMTKTGNQVLDTILAAKIFHCRKNHIQITCVADGKLLDFMHVTDICSIFGNALDNAIESVILLSDVKKRLIHVSVSARKKFVFIKIENYCEKVIEKNENQLIDTSKVDKKNHGYGLKSIRYAVEKYGGSVDFGMNGKWFELKILLPAKGDTQA